VRVILATDDSASTASGQSEMGRKNCNEIFENRPSDPDLSVSWTSSFHHPIILVMRRTYASVSRKAVIDPKL
jgi:hypothetical protein